MRFLVILLFLDIQIREFDIYQQYLYVFVHDTKPNRFDLPSCDNGWSRSVTVAVLKNKSGASH